MAQGKCQKCNRYGYVERHHPLPRRWFGRGPHNSWTEPLCAQHHKEADTLTLRLDQEKQITNQAEAKYYRQLFVELFAAFVNGETVFA